MLISFCYKSDSVLQAHSFLYSVPLCFIARCWIWLPVLYGRILSFTHFACNNLHLLTPHSASPSLLLPPLPRGNQESVLYACESVSFVDKLICVIFSISWVKWYLRYSFFSFWCTSLSMIISGPICVAANGIISFFLWLSSIPFHPLYPLICQWNSRLLPCLGYSSMVLLWTPGCVYLLNYSFVWVYAWEWNCWII